MTREAAIRELHRRRPRSLFLRLSGAAAIALLVVSWWSGDFAAGQLLSERRLNNLQRFLSELRPHPLQGREFDLGIAWQWARDLLADRGLTAAAATLAISMLAIVLAGAGAALLCLPAARNFAAPDPFTTSLREPPAARRMLWKSLTFVSRSVLVFARAVPEYIWAFLLLILLGPNAWPAVLALAIHNAGILGKLASEVIEDLDHAPLAALRAAGASRSQIAVTAIAPLVFNRTLLFFFYRWETCVRDATILGLLGIVSLGYWIQDARARNHYDEMFLLILVGAALVVIADVVSMVARESVRRSS
ncbi:MAG TPA: ABC transporter permease subunit [Thermoanaerobaculia bacterium]|nr:ABC transporter permease subunit [Thermoanaerobaculia bacterium]